MLETWKKWVIPCSSTNLLGMLLLVSSCLMQLLANAVALAQGVPPDPGSLGTPQAWDLCWVFLPRLAPCSHPSVLTAGLSFLPQA